MEQSAAMAAYGLGSALLYLAPLLGGLVALFTAPRWLLVLGMALAMLGYVALGSTSAGMLALPVGLLVLGQGLSKPALFAVAAHELKHPHESGRNALFVALFVAINSSVVFSAFLGGPLPLWVGHSGLFFVVASLVACSTLLAAGMVALLRDMRPPPSVPPGRSRRGVGVLLSLSIPFMLAQQVSLDIQTRQQLLEGGPGWSMLFRPDSPVLFMLLGSMLVAVLAALAHVGREVPTLLLVCVGLALSTVSTALMSSVEGASHPLPALMLATLTRSLAEVLVPPLILSRVAADTSRRFAPLVIAGWMVLNTLLGQAVGAGVMVLEWHRGLAALAMVGCAAASFVAFARWRSETREGSPVGGDSEPPLHLGAQVVADGRGSDDAQGRPAPSRSPPASRARSRRGGAQHQRDEQRDPRVSRPSAHSISSSSFPLVSRMEVSTKKKEATAAAVYRP